jgi:antitoxin YefM
MTTLTVTAAKSRLLGVLRKVHDLHETCALTHNGQPYAVIMSNDDYEGMLETVNILKDKVFSKALMNSIKRADKGKTVSFESATGRKQKK